MSDADSMGDEALHVAQVREIDARAMDEYGIAGIVLMENAGRGCAEFIRAGLARAERDAVLILCGGGNNGGDGFVIARHLINAGVNATVALAIPPEKIGGDAATNLRILERMNARMIRAYAARGADPDADSDGAAGAEGAGALDVVRAAAVNAAVIVDALLGTGATGAPRGAIGEMVRIANASAGRRIAIDTPTGLDAETGEVHEPCFRAETTLTMVAAKVGFAATAAARGVVGRVVVIDIGVPRELLRGRKKSPGGA